MGSNVVCARGKLNALLLVTTALAVAGWLTPAAFAADSIYWSTGPTLRVGSLSGGTPASTLFSGESGSFGIAIDSATGKIYWADSNTGTIRVGNLDGSGTASTLFSGQTNPYGVAINPALGKIYWANSAANAIEVANLDGTGSPQGLFTGENDPRYLAIDPAAGKLYWIDVNNGAIRVGNLDGSGTPATLFTDANDPAGIALDSETGELYWSDFDTGTIQVANADGTGLPQTLFGGESYPEGLALDPTAGKIYWANYSNGEIRVANLDGTGVPENLYSGEVETEVPAILRAPAGTGAPQVSGGSSVGSVLSCSQGSWAPDFPGAFFYRAPHSFSYQWTFNGADIAGATSSSYTAPAGGAYACGVTAANDAGSASQTSAAFTVTGAGTPPATVLALTNASQSHRRWREGSALPHIARLRVPLGTTFRFTLNQSAEVRFVFKEVLPGRSVDGRCLAPTRSRLSKPRCWRKVVQGKLLFTLGAGAHKLRFKGRISRHRRLPAGQYVLVIKATDAAGEKATARLTFTIV